MSSLIARNSRKTLDKSVLVRYNIITGYVNLNGGVIMSVTAAELKMDLNKYLKIAQTEDVLITENGKVIAKLSNPNVDRRAIAESLFGIIPPDITLEEARDERLSKI